MEDYTIEERPLATQWYIYKGKISRYADRGPVACVMTVTYSRQGAVLYVTGTHDGEMPPGFRGAVKRFAKSKGVKKIEWEHRGQIREEAVS